jgi:predicted NACHT family NTPase
MNQLSNILTAIITVTFIVLLLGGLILLLSRKLFYPLLSQSNKLLKKRPQKDYESAYLEYVIESCRDIVATRESVHISPKVRLQNFFVTPFLADEEGNNFKYTNKFFNETNAQAFLIVGAPGSGKTTLLRYIQYEVSSESLEEESSSERIFPFLLSLRDVQGFHTKALPALLEKHSPSIEGEKPRERFYNDFLNSGRLLLLLDGLDEIRNEESVNEIIGSIASWRQMYTSCKIIVTSRPTHMELLKSQSFKKLALLPFTDGQITEFVRKWTSNIFEDLSYIFEDPSSYQQNRLVLKRLALENMIMSQPDLKELASSPILLTLMCTTHYFTGVIPANRTFLFQEIVSLLLKKVYVNFPKHQLQLMIEKIAFQYHTDRVVVADRRYLLEIIRRSIMELSISVSAEEILSELIERSGVLFERGPDQISFAHYSFQEFFAARYLIDFDTQSTDFKDLLNDQWWRDVILLSTESAQDIEGICMEIINASDIPDLDKVQLIGRIIAIAKNADRKSKAKIIEKVISDIFAKESDETKHQMLLLASPNISSEIITMLGG